MLLWCSIRRQTPVSGRAAGVIMGMLGMNGRLVSVKFAVIKLCVVSH